MQVSIKIDTAPFAAALTQLADKDIGWACADAMNLMAEEIHKDLVGRMNVVFDRPTDYTLNAFHIGKATERRQETFVAQKDSSRYEGREYLRVQEYAGPRRRKGIETAFAMRLAYEGHIQSILPGDNAKIDKFGNWSRGEQQQIMSQLRVQRDKAMNTTKASRKRNPRRTQYFVPKKGPTPPGIYKRGNGRDILPVAIFSQEVPVYTAPRLGFFDNAERLFMEKAAGYVGRFLGEKMAKRFG